MISALKKSAKAFLKRHRHLERLYDLHFRRNHLGRRHGYPAWGEMLAQDGTAWDSALAAAARGPEVLIATSVGAYLPGTTVESLLAVALALRGARAQVLLCDSALPACFDCHVNWFPNQDRFVRFGPAKDLCRACFSPARDMFATLGIPVLRYGDFLSEEDKRKAREAAFSIPSEDIPSYIWEGLAVGEQAKAGALRFFARATLEDEPKAEPVLRRYFEAALLTAFASRRLFRSRRFDAAVFHHGIYVPQGVIGAAARQEKVRVVNWNPAYRKKCFIFSQGDSYHRTLMSEPMENWENMDFTPDMEEDILAYLKSRRHGTEDWIWFHEAPREAEDDIARELPESFRKPCVGLLTNVMWDAQLHYPANAFSNMADWIIRTIAYFAGRPDLELLIRVHPAEIRGTIPSRQPVAGEIRRAFPTLPRNVHVIPPESRLSTYAVMAKCNAAIVYGTKTGVELASMGIPVIAAGEAWIRNKGLTMDVSSPEEYLKVLDRLPFSGPMDAEAVRRARKYAYHFFFRRMIPLEFMEQKKYDPPFRIASLRLDDFRPGRSPGLDIICDGILKGSEFIYPAETLRRTQVPSLGR